MATLQIEFNCLCMFVPDERDPSHRVVHVLMPDTTKHFRGEHGAEQHAGHGGPRAQGEDLGCGDVPEPHVVRLYHSALADPNQGIPMEGWTLVLGGASNSAETGSLAHTSPGMVVDLTYVTSDAQGSNGRKVPRLLVDGKHEKVISRVSLYGGQAVEAPEQIEWKIKKVGKFKMAYQVVWQIDDVSETLEWLSVNTGDPPLKSLKGLPVEQLEGGKEGYLLKIFHTLPCALPPCDQGDGTMKPAIVKEHFRHFYVDLLDYKPGDDELPSPPHGIIGKVHCGTAQAQLE